MFGMGTYFKAAALGSGGACKRGKGKKDGSIIYIFLHERSESCKLGAGLMRAVGRVSMETLNKIENTLWRGSAETLVPLKSRVLLIDFALFFPRVVSQCLTNKIKMRVFLTEKTNRE